MSAGNQNPRSSGRGEVNLLIMPLWLRWLRVGR